MKKLFNGLTSYEKVSFVINGLTINGLVPTYAYNYMKVHCGLRPSEMMEVIEDREMWRLNIELLPPQPSRKKREIKKEEKGKKAK